MEKKDYKIAIYARTAQADEVRIATQVNLCESYCKYKNYPKVVKIYKDNGKSGLTENRSAYKRLLKDIRDGKINVIVVSDFERLTRQPLYFYHKMVEYITKKKLYVFCICNPVDDIEKFRIKFLIDFAILKEEYSDGGVE